MATGEDAARLAALDDALRRVRDRWTLLLVATLLDGPRRFGELTERSRASLRTCSPSGSSTSSASPSSSPAPTNGAPRVSSTARRDGRRAGQRPPPPGRLGARTSDAVDPPRHDLCGTPVEARWWCPTCEVAVDIGDEAEELRRA